MQNLKLKSICGAFVALFCLGCLNSANAEERTFLQRFANFFTPSGSIKGEGPIFDELKGVESQIDKIEVQYTRERRAGNKTRYRKQLDSLRNVRDSLITVIEKMPSSGSVAASSPSSVSSSAAKVAVSQPVSATSPALSSAANVLPASSSANVACVHDTLYVVLANKPDVPAPKENKKADKVSEK